MFNASSSTPAQIKLAQDTVAADTGDAALDGAMALTGVGIARHLAGAEEAATVAESTTSNASKASGATSEVATAFTIHNERVAAVATADTSIFAQIADTAHAAIGNAQTVDSVRQLAASAGTSTANAVGGSPDGPPRVESARRAFYANYRPHKMVAMK